MDYSPPSSSVHEISQARILEWVAIYVSRGSSHPNDQTCVSCLAGQFFTTEPPGKQSTVVQYLYFKPRTSKSKHKSSSDICGVAKKRFTTQEMAGDFIWGGIAQFWGTGPEQRPKVTAAIQNAIQDFPGGLLVNSPQANARDTGLILYHVGKSPHDTGQLNPCATTTEAQALKLVFLNKRSHHNKEPIHRNQRAFPHFLQLEKAWAQQERPSTVKNK